jgi:hypothetical protein
MSRSRIAPLVGAVATAVLAFGGTVLTAAPAQAAATTLWVRAGGTGDCTTLALACGTIQLATGTAGSLTGRDVTVDIGPGTFIPTSPTDEVLIVGGSQRSLTLRGAGIGDTVLRTAQGTAQYKGTAILIDSLATFPVTVADLTIEGAGQDDAKGIWDVADHLLRLERIHITGLSAATNNSAIGVLDTDGQTEITRTWVGDLHGGTGGNAQGVLILGSRLTMDSSLVAGVHGGQGNVGIGISGGGPGARISDSTVADITGGTEGYGVWFDGTTDDPASLTHVTIAGADRGALLEHATLRASLLRNTANCTPDVGYVDGGFNAVTDPTSGGCFTEPTDIFGLDPAALGPLADNGGPTPTAALDAVSPAATAVGPAALCLGTDQRGPGHYRPATNCAAGAYEPGALSRRPGSEAGPQVPTGPADPPAPSGPDGEPCGAITSRAKC